MIKKMQQLYVSTFMLIVERGLESLSNIDDCFKHEMKGYPVGLTIAMTIFGSDAKLTIKVQPDQTFKSVDLGNQKADLTLMFKHIDHAFLVFTMQESTAQSFANDRIIVDGELGYAIRLVRCMDRMEALILPKIVAQLAVKQYPADLTLTNKLTLATQTYGKIATSVASSIPSLLRR